MQIRTQLGAAGGGNLVWWVCRTLEGFAMGAVPTMSSVPPLYSTGVRYREEPHHGTGDEEFAEPRVTLARGWGDCDDLVYWRLAELYRDSLPMNVAELPFATQLMLLDRMKAKVARGKLPTCRGEWRGNEVHVMIRYPDGSIEDPSVLLGARLQ